MPVLQILADASAWGHMGGWGMGWGMIGWLIITLFIVVVAWVLWATTRRDQHEGRQSASALDVLDRRYAAGEIGRDEYLERRSDLE